MQPENYGSKIVSGWLESSKANWLEYTDHEFVKGLGDGTLPRSAFITYLIQDYIFLLHYSRSWAMAVVKAETISQMRLAAATMNGLINEEVQLHIGICKREGISESDLLEAEEAYENIAYTRYVMDTAISGDLLDLLAVLAPCVFGYGHIGLNLASSENATALYREWIDAYSGEDYQSSCKAVADMIEEVASQRLGPNSLDHPRWKSLCSKFDQATKLEVSFWSMGLRLGSE